MFSSAYQSTDRPLLSTRYEPLLKHLISVLGCEATFAYARFVANGVVGMHYEDRQSGA